MTQRFHILLLLILACTAAFAQSAAPTDTIYDPEVIYSPIPRQYEIAGISVSGVKNVDDYVIIGYSGLNIGEKIDIPGDAITNATKRFWRQGLYSKVRIFVTKTVGDKVWLEIALRQSDSRWCPDSRSPPISSPASSR